MKARFGTNIDVINCFENSIFLDSNREQGGSKALPLCSLLLATVTYNWIFESAGYNYVSFIIQHCLYAPSRDIFVGQYAWLIVCGMLLRRKVLQNSQNQCRRFLLDVAILVAVLRAVYVLYTFMYRFCLRIALAVAEIRE